MEGKANNISKNLDNGKDSLNNINNLDNIEETIEEDLILFIDNMKAAFIKAIDSMENKGEHTSDLNTMVEKCNLDDKRYTTKHSEMDTNMTFLKQNDNMRLLNDNINQKDELTPVIEIIDGEIKVNIPTDPETIKLWQLLRKAIDQPVINKKLEKSDKRDLLNVSKYGEDDEAFFNSLITK